MRRWIPRSLLGLLAVLLLGAGPTEWVSRGVAWYRCNSVGGDTNLSSSGSGADFVHTLGCVVDANTIKAGTVLRLCAHLTMVTGTSTPALQFKIRAGATTLYTMFNTFTPANSITRNSAVCWLAMGGAAPSAASAVYTSAESFPTQISYDDANSTGQPITLATNGALTFSFVSRWTTAGTGTNSLVLNALSLTQVQ